ncbi:cell adhesion molecule CEACAM10-like isoform X5 [Phyllobates terribilis]|uniref:cell adhesion molecule CEACAM10-like isoform X5 n=1 Tax=Phyllobates terribilis TaxID=111132 RepID=UPI003CCAAE2A
MRGFLIIVLLILTMDVTSGQISIQPIPQYPVINGSVTLSLTGITDKIEAVIWYKGPNRSPQYEILVYVPGINRTLVGRPLYNDRISVFNNGSLHIKDLRLTDGGNYKVTAPTLTSANNVDVTLTVYESSENRQDQINVYENMKTAQPNEESSYTDLQFRTENTYAELKT